jgi:outer membrane protein OmpA-like peptidoglycan-associated protein
MRTILSAGLATGALAAALSALAPAAYAQQQNPSASQIIQSLTPSGNLTHGSVRGIRLANPSAGEQMSPTQMPAGGQGSAAASPQQRSESPGAGAPASSVASQPAPHHAHLRTAAHLATAHPAPSVNLNVDFATGSTDLTQSARSTLDQLGQALSSQQLAGYRFRIVGHTDTVGAPSANKELSQRRADAVASYLEQKFNVSANRLQAEGVGEQDLLVPTPPQTSNARNRRVEVINLGA